MFLYSKVSFGREENHVGLLTTSCLGGRYIDGRNKESGQRRGFVYDCVKLFDVVNCYRKEERK